MIEDHFKSLSEISPNPYWVLDQHGTFVVCNLAAAKALGFHSVQALQTSTLANILSTEDDNKKPSEEIIQILSITQDKGTYQFEWGLKHHNGSSFPVEVLCTYTNNHYYFFWKDISERKQAEQKVSSSEKELRRIFNSIQDTYYRTNIQGEIMTISPSVKSLMGCELSDVIGKKIGQFYVDEQGREKFLHQLQKHNGVIKHYEAQVRTLDNKVIWISTSAHFLYDNQKNITGVEGIIRDITNLKLSESKVQQEAQFRSQLLDQMSEGIALWRLTDTEQFVEFLIWNRRMQEVTGYTQEEINQLGWLNTVYHDEVNRSLAKETMVHAINGSINTDTNFTITTKSGESRILHISSVSTRGPNNEPCVLAVVEDISEQRLLEEKLQHSQKMEAIGTLVGGIAHDFNNMLAAIQGNVYLGKTQTGCSIAAQKLENIEKISHRAAQMIEQLLTFARNDHTTMEVFNFNTFMEEAYELAKGAIPENIDHQTKICTDNLFVKGNPTQIQQALMNLLSNATDAVADVASPKIRCHLQPFTASASFKEMYPTLQGSHFACMSIEDNGYGIPSNQLNKIFEPFFTTKEESKGTGLGLAMLYGVIKKHGGAIEVQSEEHKGTTFNVYLPLSSEKEEQLEKKKEHFITGSGQTILVVDDEAELRMTTSEVLTQMGYQTLQASNGDEALNIFQQDNHISLILSDVVMPIMGGVELLTSIRKQNKKMPMILATGYDKHFVLKNHMQDKYCHIINKPFDFELLSQLTHELLKT